jgi:hypothetical protein
MSDPAELIGSKARECFARIYALVGLPLAKVSAGARVRVCPPRYRRNRNIFAHVVTFPQPECPRNNGTGEKKKKRKKKKKKQR